MAKQEKPCCVLTLSLKTEKWQEDIIEKRFRIMKHLYNSLLAMELRKYHNLTHTREWRNLEAQIQAASDAEKKVLYKQRSELLRERKISEYGFKDDMTLSMQKHFKTNINAQVSHRTASDVWRAFEQMIFHHNDVHFKRRGTLDSIGNQHVGNGMDYKDGYLIWTSVKIPVRPPKTAYEQDMLTKKMKNFRIVRKWVRNKYKYYLQITFEGVPSAKPRNLAEGRVGIDIGTQSIAVASEREVMLRELAPDVKDTHRKIRIIQRYMDRSRRKSNPQNYNADGTIRRGIRLEWTYSRRYLAAQGRLRELQRKNADIRKYQHYCMVNKILSLGDEVYVENMDFKALQARAKRTEINESGRFKRKKRFGKSLANKAPAMLITMLDNRLKAQTGHGIFEIDTRSYRASQYDHLSMEYRKKKLSQRNQILDNGDFVQRDMYSAFLIMNADSTLKNPDQSLCQQNYAEFFRLQNAEIARIQTGTERRLSSFGLGANRK